MNKGYVYILASKKGGALYTGVTNNLSRRIFEHKDNISGGFTTKYLIKKLVYFEQYDDIRYAILREKQLKKRKKNWKIKLIEEENPEWDDIYITTFRFRLQLHKNAGMTSKERFRLQYLTPEGLK